MEMLLGERRKNTTFQRKGEYSIPYIPFEIEKEETMLTRKIPMSPFVPENKVTRSRQCEEILMIQAVGLKKRMLHTNCQRAVVGISGDSILLWHCLLLQNRLIFSELTEVRFCQ